MATSIPSDEIRALPSTEYGPISDDLRAAIKQSGVKLQDVWGISLDPEEPLNPKRGSYYIGIIEKTDEECAQIIKAELSLLDSLKIPLAGLYFARLSQIAEGSLNEFRLEGYKAITNHEEEHKTQNIRLNSRMRLVEGLAVLNDTRKGENDVTSTEVDLFNAHHKAYLLTEVQALASQTRFDPTINPERYNFMTYWLSKTFRLFEEQGNMSCLENVYNKFVNRETDFSNISNADGLISRALFLTRNPCIIDQIQNGELTFQAFEDSVMNGLTEFLENPSVFYNSLKNPDYIIALDSELMKNLNELDVETHKRTH
jgi:hypothetical protein